MRSSVFSPPTLLVHPANRGENEEQGFVEEKKPRFHIHHQNGTLDRLLAQIVFLARDVVGTHDAALHTSGNPSGEDTTESVETSFVGGRYHFRDVHHQGSVGVAVLDTHSSFIFMWSFIQHLHTIGLSCCRWWQVDGNHLKKSLTSGQPLTNDGCRKKFQLFKAPKKCHYKHTGKLLVLFVFLNTQYRSVLTSFRFNVHFIEWFLTLEKMLSILLSVFNWKFDAQFDQQIFSLLFLVVHDGINNLEK